MTVFILISWSFKTIIDSFYNKMDAEANMEYYKENDQYGDMEILAVFVDTKKEIL